MEFSAARVGGFWRAVWWAVALVLLALAAALLFVPGWLGGVRYQLSAGTLVASGDFKSVQIPVGAVKDVRVTALRGLRRADGKALGPGPCVGEYRSERYARLLMYGDCTSPAVVFVADGRRYAVTPEDPEAFVAAWREGLTLGFAPPVSRAPPPAWRPAALCGGLGALIALLLARARRLGYLLAPAGLAVSTAFGELRVPYGQITRVWLSPARLGVPLLALCLPGYAVGRFAWRGVPGALDAAASSARAPGVVVEYAGRYLFLTPHDPRAFASELERRRTRTTQWSQWSGR